MRPIGLLGGSFDPIHFGHLRSAEEVREALGLDRVWFVPAATPPHKPGRDLCDATKRLRMIEIAIADNPAFAVSRVELDRGGISYSVDTIEAVRFREPEADLHFIVGADAFREIHTWRDSARLFALTNVVVTTRPPHAAEPDIGHLPVAAREAFCYDSSTRSYRHSSGTTLRFLAITPIDVSATAIRAALRARRSIRYLVPPAIERFIDENLLYRGVERD